MQAAEEPYMPVGSVDLIQFALKAGISDSVTLYKAVIASAAYGHAFETKKVRIVVGGRDEICCRQFISEGILFIVSTLSVFQRQFNDELNVVQNAYGAAKQALEDSSGDSDYAIAGLVRECCLEYNQVRDKINNVQKKMNDINTWEAENTLNGFIFGDRFYGIYYDDSSAYVINTMCPVIGSYRVLDNCKQLATFYSVQLSCGGLLPVKSLALFAASYFPNNIILNQVPQEVTIMSADGCLAFVPKMFIVRKCDPKFHLKETITTPFKLTPAAAEFLETISNVSIIPEPRLSREEIISIFDTLQYLGCIFA